MKNVIPLFIVSVVAAVMAGCSATTNLTSSGITTPLDIPKPAGLTATAGAHSFNVLWNAVSGAASYNLYYTSDGTAPTQLSASVTGITSTSYTVNLLDPTKSYRFAVAAVESSTVGPLSLSTSAQQPLYLLTIRANYTSSYANKPVGAIYYACTSGGNDHSVTPPSSQITGVQIKATDSTGAATFTFPIKSGDTIGLSLFEDNNSDGQLDTGDQVWQTSGAGTLEVACYGGEPVAGDVTKTYDPWAGGSQPMNGTF